MKKKIITFLITVLIIFAALFFAAFFGLKITKVQVTGNSIYSENEVINTQMKGRFSHHTLFMFIKEKIAGPEKMPFAQEIDVSFPDLHTIRFEVYEKNITSCVKAVDQYAYIDNDGLVLRCMDRKIKGVTEITGVGLNSFTVGKKLDVTDDDVFKKIVNVSKLISYYKMNVKKVIFKKNEVTLKNHFVTVYLGDKDDYDDEMSALAAILPKIRKRRIYGVIDMTIYQRGDRVIVQPRKNSAATRSAVAATGAGAVKNSGF